MKTGKKIKDNFEGKRANHYLNAIIKREPHQEFNRLLHDALGYKFGTQAQFALMMEINGYRAQKKEGKLLFFKHGKKQGEISLADVDNKIKLDENESRNTSQIKALIYKYQRIYSGKLRCNHDQKYTTEKKKFESDLTNFLKDKFGLGFIFFTGKHKDKPYGYTIIDHHNREVYKGSDVLKLDYLIADSLRNEKKDFVSADREVETFQNNKNSFQGGLSPKVFEADFVAKGNTFENEIQLGDLFEDFIRELERENDENNGRVRTKRRPRRGI